MCADLDGVPWTMAVDGGGGHALVSLRDTIEVEATLPPDSWFGGCAPAPRGLWVGLGSGLWHLDGGVLREVPGPKILSGGDGTMGSVHTMVVTDDGLLHVLGSERECHVDATRLFAAVEGAISPDWVCAPRWSGPPPRVALGSDGQLWAAGLSTGVLVETREGWVSHRSSHTLPSPSVWSLVRSSRGGVWIVGVGGLVRVRPTPPDQRWDVLERVGGAQGLPVAGVESLVEMPGALWLAGERGVLSIPDAARTPAPPPPAPVLTDVWVDGVWIRPEGDSVVEVGWPHNQVEIRAASTIWADRSRLRFRVRLSEDDPGADSPDPTLRLVDLPAGTYTVLLQVSADDGLVWSDPSAPLRLHVALPLYLRPPALILGGVLTVILVITTITMVVRARIAAASRLARERDRIAMDLHDDLGAGLSTITMLAGLANDPELDDAARREVSGEVSLVAATLTESLADIVWTLRRDAGRPEVLARSLADRARRLLGPSGVKLTLNLTTEWPDVLLPLTLYRNIQLIGYEALQNVARHADAHEVRLTFRPWTLEIDDDGRGLTTISPRAGTGTGLQAMQARAKTIGGTLEIQERPGGGTSVRLRFPAPRAGWRRG